MEIVVLDALTLGNDMDLNRFERFGKLSVYQTTKPDELKERIANVDIIITNKVFLGKKEIDFAPKLKLICVAATGYNNIEIAWARKKGIVVANVRNYSTESVAQHTFSLILALENSLVDYITDTKTGKWINSPVFNMLNYTFNELKGRKLGIIGYGNIGKRVAQIGQAFGMQILIGKRKGIEYEGTERIDFDLLIKKADIISIHAPLSENTLNLFTMAEFKKMKPDAAIINVARGGIVNEDDLYTALSEKIIRAAAIDVLDSEPMNCENKLYRLNNILISPHIAWTSYQSRLKLLEGIESNIEKFIDGSAWKINLAI